MQRRAQKGGVWAEDYIFPELVFGIRACQNDETKVLSSKEEEEILTNVTERLRDYFNKFLDEVCNIKRDGLSYKSFRHTNLPYLRYLGAPDEVGLDMAGQLSLSSYLGYGNHGVPEQYVRAAELLEQHYLNIKNGKKERVFLTFSDLAAHTSSGFKNLKEDVTVLEQQLTVHTSRGFKDLKEEVNVLERQLKCQADDERRKVERAMRRNHEELFRHLRRNGSLEVAFRPADLLPPEARAAILKLDSLFSSVEDSTAEKLLMLLCACDSELLSVVQPHFLNWCQKRRIEFHEDRRPIHDFGPAPASLEDTLCLLFSESLENTSSSHE